MASVSIRFDSGPLHLEMNPMTRISAVHSNGRGTGIS